MLFRAGSIEMEKEFKKSVNDFRAWASRERLSENERWSVRASSLIARSAMGSSDMERERRRNYRCHFVF